MIELVVTIVVIGILAAVIMPRFASKSDFDARGFFDATASLLRYAQKSSVAQRREVCVGFGAGSTVTLTIASTFGGPCNTPLIAPDGQPYTITPPQNVGFAATPADFSFLPSGAASDDRVLTVAGLAAKKLSVWSMTGYVQED